MGRLLSCALLLVATSTLVAAQEPVGICALDGFILNDLYFGQFWNFSVPEPQVNCLHEIAAENVSSCSIYFSVCKPLPSTICGGISNATYCQVVTAKDGSHYYYDAGNYTTRHNFLALSDGFSSIRYGGKYPNTEECGNSTFITTTNFECDSDAKFNISQPDITQYLTTIERPIACANIIFIKYSGACYQQPTLAPSHCSLTGFDTTAISQMDYFRASVSSGVCYNFDNEECMILFAFCHPLPLDISEQCSNPESAICQADKLEEASISWSMGAYENYTRFYENVDTDQVGFHALYSYGSNPGDPDCTSGISTRMIFVCNEDAKWNNRDITFYVEVEKENCFYNIIAQYDGACYKAHDINGDSHGRKTSYIGWIFIAIFMFAVLTYLVAGSAFQYFVKQQRGMRVLPNFDFWRNFVLLTMEGCKYSLDVITCNRFSGVPGKPKVNYDQL